MVYYFNKHKKCIHILVVKKKKAPFEMFSSEGGKKHILFTNHSHKPLWQR